jgi:prenyl protein peptidase
MYTSLFGFIAAFIYLRTSSLVACILAHSFCNWMGLPRLLGLVGEASDHDMLETDVSVSGDSTQAGPRSRQLCIIWTSAYYVLLVSGAVMFWKLRWSLTASNLALIQF